MLDPKTVEKTGSFECLALVVDINASERLLAVDEWEGTAQFFRDLLYGSVRAIEDAHGSVINFIGDGLTAVLPSEEDAGMACMAIAHDLRKTRDYLVSNGPEAFPQLKVGVGLKMGIERRPDASKQYFVEIRRRCALFFRGTRCLRDEDLSLWEGRPLSNRPKSCSKLALWTAGRSLRSPTSNIHV